MKSLSTRGRWLIVIAAAACVPFAVAATIEDAQRIVDLAEPLQCEIHALEGSLEGTAAGTEEFAKAADEIRNARARLKSHYMATMTEYIEVMKTLSFEDRKKVYAYSSAVADRCPPKAGLKEPAGKR
jgi:Spy/CpxP family protein refolding chaperone